MTVLPGPSAVETALVVSGFVVDRYLFVGYLPRRRGELRELAREVAAWPGAVVAFDSPSRLPGSLAALAEELPERDGAVCRELTKRYEEVTRGSLRELASHFTEPARGEITLVVGPGEGADRAAAADEEARRAVAELVEAGASRRRAAEVVSRLTGAARNALYRDSL